MMYFGEKLRRLRQASNLTQPDLAEQLGVEQSWLSKLENDKCTPSSDLLDRVSRVFEMPLEQLLAELDPTYVRDNLASLPEVRGLLLQKKYQLVHSAKAWLLAATVCTALGITAIFTGKENLLFNDQLYVYESLGLVYATEPEMLFSKQSDILNAMAQSENPWGDSRITAIRARQREAKVSDFFQRKQLQLKQRQHSEQEITYQFRGDHYRKEATATKVDEDIFGNTVAAGSPAHRIYSLTESKADQAQWKNRILILLGILLTVFGLLLYFVEWRMTLLTKRLL